MGFQWKGNTLTVAVELTSKKALDKLIWAVNDIGNIVLSRAADDMVKTIKTTPSSIRIGKPNRVDTGLMKDSVDVEDMHKTGKSKYSGAAGWVELVEDYFLIQDQGGMSSGLTFGDRYITPMHALSKAFYKMKEELADELRHLRP